MDTRNKRASAIGVGLAFLVVLPAPDATIDQADRQQVSASYAGVLAGPPQPIAPPRILADISRSGVTRRRITGTVERLP